MVYITDHYTWSLEGRLGNLPKELTLNRWMIFGWMYISVDECIYGWMNVYCIYGWMNVYMVGWMYKRLDECINGWMNVNIVVWIFIWLDEYIYACMNVYMVGCM